MVQETRKALGERLRDARERAGYTQMDAARAIGKELSPQTWLSHIERGRNDISTEDLLALAQLYGVPVGKLMGEREPMSENILSRLGDVLLRNTGVAR